MATNVIVAAKNHFYGLLMSQSEVGANAFTRLSGSVHALVLELPVTVESECMSLNGREVLRGGTGSSPHMFRKGQRADGPQQAVFSCADTAQPGDRYRTGGILGTPSDLCPLFPFRTVVYIADRGCAGRVCLWHSSANLLTPRRWQGTKSVLDLASATACSVKYGRLLSPAVVKWLRY